MASLNQYRCEDAGGSEITRFDTFREAEDYAKEHDLRVIEEEYEYADSSLVSDYTSIQKRFVVEINVVFKGKETDYKFDEDSMESELRDAVLHYTNRGMLTERFEELTVADYEVEVDFQEEM